MAEEQILKKESGLKLGGAFGTSGNLVLTMTELYFATKTKRLWSVPLKSIQSVNCKKGIGTGVEHLYVTYQENGKEKTQKIQHYGFWSAATIGNLSRLTFYFTSWEQTINDARFGRSGNSAGTSSGLGDLEKLAELKEKGIITEEEFVAKKKQMLGL